MPALHRMCLSSAPARAPPPPIAAFHPNAKAVPSGAPGAPELQPAIEDEAAWQAAFIEATEGVRGTMSHAESAEAMRALVRTGLLRHTDIRDRPERFFKAHRLLARHAVAHGPGFWIRFTVHYNLCYGTVMAVGGPEQIASLDDAQARGQLGCFALTERLAGVQSGLVVQTRAEYDPEAREFVLDTPSDGASKHWISQGFSADKAVVLAELTLRGERKGPHAFLIDLRRGGELTAGVSVGDMGVKTTGNDLDNAWIRFERVRVPHASLLNAHCAVDPASAEYTLTTPGLAPFAMIGQRLYSGRVAVAQAALSYARELFRVTRAYADAKPIWSAAAEQGGPERALSSIPQLRALFAEADASLGGLECFVGQCEAELTPLLRAGQMPGVPLAHAIAVAKVKAVEASIDLCWRLKQEVGSYALMGDSGFAHLDFLCCCKFAEGDSRILMQKMARDALKRFAKEPAALGDGEAARLCAELGTALRRAGKDKAAQAAAWDEQHALVYALAEAIMEGTMKRLRG